MQHQIKSKSAQKEELIWAPQKGPQTLLCICPVQDILYGGARGGGKTDGTLGHWMYHSLEYTKHAKGLFIRRTMPELEEVISRARTLFSDVAEWKEQKKTLVFHNGATLKFRFLERDIHADRYQGHEYSWICIEEAGNFPSPDPVDKLRATLRSAVGAKTWFILTANPGGCIPYGEVLTADRGWMDIKDIKVGDNVVSVRQDGTSCVKPVAGVVCYQNDKKMFKYTHKDYEMVFNEEHRFPHFDEGNASHTVKGYRELPYVSYIRRTGSPLPGDHPENIWGFDPEDLVELLGYLIAIPPQIEAVDGETILVFPSKKLYGTPIHDIGPLLERMFISYYTTTKSYVKNFHIRHRVLAEKLDGYLDKHTHRLPRRFLSLDSGLLRIFFRTLMNAGHKQSLFLDTSEELADQVSEIAVKLGYSVQQRKTGTWRKKRIRHTVAINRSMISTRFNKFSTHENARHIEKQNITSFEYNKNVYCLTIPETETFFVRQNGSIWLSGNSGHNWIKSRYIDPAPPLTPFETAYTVGDHNFKVKRIYIPSKLSDNKILIENDPNYVNNVATASAGRTWLYKAWMSGDWNIVAGGMFDDVFREDVHILKPFKIPSTWSIYRSFDWGSSKPFSIGWWAKSDGSPCTLANGKRVAFPTGSLIRIDEWYGYTGNPDEGLDMDDRDIAKKIVEHEKLMGWDVEDGPADPMIFNETNGGCIADFYTAEGIYWVAADKGVRVTGWKQVKALLSESLKEHPENPCMYIFDVCVEWRRTVPTAVRSKTNIDDIDTDSEDHICDEMRYMVRFEEITVEQSPLGGL